MKAAVPCARCGRPLIIGATRCVWCRKASERDLWLVESMRLFARMLVWFVCEAYHASPRTSTRGVETHAVWASRWCEIGAAVTRGHVEVRLL